MKIGDRVTFTNMHGNTFFGNIVSEKNYKCRCKGKDKWLVKFDGENDALYIRKDDNQLKLSGIDIKKTAPKHTM